jgi:hypothetical protein
MFDFIMVGLMSIWAYFAIHAGVFLVNATF